MSEKQNIEYKQSWRDEYLKWICGFANAQGGKIYIGIDDVGKVVGLADYKKLMDFQSIVVYLSVFRSLFVRFVSRNCAFMKARKNNFFENCEESVA